MDNRNNKRERLKSAEENAFRRSNKFMSEKAQAKNLNEMADSLSEIGEVNLGISNLNKNFELFLQNIQKNILNKREEDKKPFEFSTPPIIQLPKNIENKNNEDSNKTTFSNELKEKPRETLNVESMFKSIIENIQIGFSSLSNKEKNGILKNNNDTKIESITSNPISQINDLDSKLIKIELPFDNIENDNVENNKTKENLDVPNLLKTNSILENLSKNIVNTLDKTLNLLASNNPKEKINPNPTNSIEKVFEKQTVNNTIKEIQQIDYNTPNSNLDIDNILEKTNNYFSNLEKGINLLTTELSKQNTNDILTNTNKKVPNEILDSITLSNKNINNGSNLVELNSELDKKISNIQNLIKSLQEEGQQQTDSQNKRLENNNVNLNNTSNKPETVTEVKNISNVNNTLNSINEKNISNEQNILNKISELVNSLSEKNIVEKESISELISKVSNVKTDEKSSILDIKNVFSDIVNKIEKNTENVKNTQTNVLDKNNIRNTITDTSYSKVIQNTISDISNTLNNELNKITNTSNIEKISNQTNKLNEKNTENNVLNEKNNLTNTSNILTDVKKVLNSIEVNSKTKLDEYITNTKNNVLDTINTSNVNNEQNTIVDKIKELSNNIYNENTLNTANKNVENLTNTNNLKNIDKENIKNKENIRKEDVITKMNTKDFIQEYLKNIQNLSNNETNTTNIENRKNVLIDDSNLISNIQKLESEPIQLNSILKNDSDINLVSNNNKTQDKELPNKLEVNPLAKLDTILDKFKNLENKQITPNFSPNPNISTLNAIKNAESNFDNNEFLLSKGEQFPISNVLQNITDTLTNLANIQNKSNVLDTANPNTIGKPNIVSNNKIVETTNTSASFNSIEKIKRIEEIIENNKSVNTTDNLVEIKKLNSNISDTLPAKLGLALMNNKNNTSNNNQTGNNEDNQNALSDGMKIDTSKLEELSNKNMDMQTQLLTKLLNLFENGIKVNNFEKSDAPIVLPFQNPAPQTERSIIF